MSCFLNKKSLHKVLTALLLIGMILPLPMTFSTEASNVKIIYVKQNATGYGLSWDDAFGNLHTALMQAYPGDQVAHCSSFNFCL